MVNNIEEFNAPCVVIIIHLRSSVKRRGGKFARGRRSQWIIGRIYRRGCARNSSARNDDRELGETSDFANSRNSLPRVPPQPPAALSSLTDEGSCWSLAQEFRTRTSWVRYSAPEYPSWEKYGKWRWIKKRIHTDFFLLKIISDKIYVYNGKKLQ